MTAPLIGITERRLSTAQIHGAPLTILDTWMSAQLVHYAHAIARAGGIPVHVSREADPVSLIRRLDGLVCAGGLDIDPRLYGSVPSPKNTVIDPQSDRFEISLVLEALQEDVPVLGICRGMELINVALGGTLVEDLPVGTGDSHSYLLYPPHERVHPVSFTLESVLHGIYGAGIMVNSLHHQAVSEPGSGVVVVGRADDGVAEALQVDGQRAIGVQWHPEFFRDPDPVFDWLIGEAAAGSPKILVTEAARTAAST